MEDSSLWTVISKVPVQLLSSSVDPGVVQLQSVSCSLELEDMG